MAKILFLLKPNALISSIFQEEGFRYEEYQNIEGVYYLLIEKEGIALASGILSKINPELYQINYLAVNKIARKLKIGTYAVKAMCTKVKILGGRNVIVTSPSSLIPFFKNLDFKIIDNIENNSFLMKKRLKFAKYSKNNNQY